MRTPSAGKITWNLTSDMIQKGGGGVQKGHYKMERFLIKDSSLYKNNPREVQKNIQSPGVSNPFIKAYK